MVRRNHNILGSGAMVQRGKGFMAPPLPDAEIGLY